MKTDDQLVELQTLALWFDLQRFLAGMVHRGDAYVTFGSFKLSLSPGTTFTLAGSNPAGWVYIPIDERVTVDAEGILDFTITRDEKLFFDMPAVVNHFSYNWLIFPLVGSGVLERTYSVVVTNPDVFDHWFVKSYLAVYVKTERYAEFRDLLSLASTRYWKTAK